MKSIFLFSSIFIITQLSFSETRIVELNSFMEESSAQYNQNIEQIWEDVSFELDDLSSFYTKSDYLIPEHELENNAIFNTAWDLRDECQNISSNNYVIALCFDQINTLIDQEYNLNYEQVNNDTVEQEPGRTVVIIPRERLNQIVNAVQEEIRYVFPGLPFGQSLTVSVYIDTQANYSNNYPVSPGNGSLVVKYNNGSDTLEFGTGFNPSTTSFQILMSIWEQVVLQLSEKNISVSQAVNIIKATAKAIRDLVKNGTIQDSPQYYILLMQIYKQLSKWTTHLKFQGNWSFDNNDVLNSLQNSELGKMIDESNQVDLF